MESRKYKLAKLGIAVQSVGFLAALAANPEGAVGLLTAYVGSVAATVAAYGAANVWQDKVTTPKDPQP